MEVLSAWAPVFFFVYSLIVNITIVSGMERGGDVQLQPS
jgi:hypothetical protein